MKIAAVVILYIPPDSTISNIVSYYNYVDKIFVYDNTETEPLLQESLLKLSKIEYYHDFKNEGIAKRLNLACEIALQQQFDWMLTMDQDSAFSEDAIHTYFNCFQQFQNRENVSIFGTNNGREIRSNSTNCQIKEVEDLITSGTLLNLSLFKKIGSFDEALFIDSVDREYCIRSKLSGYSIIQFTNIYFIHKLGTEVNRSSIKSLFIIKKKKEIHSPLRCYYIYRNMLYLEKKYKNLNEKFAKQIRRDVLIHIKKCLLYGRDIKNYLKYLKAAKRDFVNNKMGEIQEQHR